MEVLAARVDRLEVLVEGVQRDPLCRPGARQLTDIDAKENLEWRQRLDRVETLLPAFRVKRDGTEGSQDAAEDAFAELAEMMLTGLRDVQTQVRTFCSEASSETLRRGEPAEASDTATSWKTNLDQVMLAMEALANQRNDDIRVINEQLEEVYSYVQRFAQRQGGDSSLEAKMAAANPARAAAKEEAEQSSLKRCMVLEDRVETLTQLSEYRTKAEARREVAVTELRREVTSLRIEVGELALGVNAASAAGDLDSRLAVLQSELEARLKAMSIETSQRVDNLDWRLQVMFGRDADGKPTWGIPKAVNEELDGLRRNLSAANKEMVRVEADLRNRVAASERELRGEVRSIQRLALEAAEKRPTSIAEGRGGGTTGGLGVRFASEVAYPSIPGEAKVAGPTLPQSIASFAPEAGVGALALLGDSAVEWRVPAVMEKVRAGDSQVLISSAFQVQSFPQLKALKLKLFPLGSKRRTQAGFCSVYLSGAQAMHVQFLLRLGRVEHGPLECFFDSAGKDHGRHDFCRIDQGSKTQIPSYSGCGP